MTVRQQQRIPRASAIRGAQGPDAPARTIDGTHESGETIPYVARVAICLLIGVATALVGNFSHRMGADRNIPYGLLLAFLLIGIGVVFTRSFAGTVGAAVHLIISSLVVWQMSAYGPGGDILMPTGGASLVTFLSRSATMLWMGGMLAIQIVAICLPTRLFARLNRTPSAAEETQRV